CRTFMQPILDNPFRAAEATVARMREETPNIIVDVHGETTSEKIAMGRFLDGRVSAVLGTHTHVQTADERILPGGTGYITDVGCCGPYNGIIGMERQGVFRRLIDQIPTRFEVVGGPAMMNGIRFLV